MQFLWDNLICDCGSIQFIPLIELRWKPEGGTVQRPTGRFCCAKCKEIIDSVKLIDAAKVKNRKRALEELQNAVE